MPLDASRALRILHLEDDPRDAERIGEQLASSGFACRVRRVSTRDAFEEAIAGGDVDLILADRFLPDFDGLEALDLVRARCPRVPVILVSGDPGVDRAVARALAAAEDRGRREDAEGRYAALVEAAQAGIVLTAKAGGILQANPCFQEMVGRRIEELARRPVEELVDPGHVASFRAAITGLTPGCPAGLELRLARPDGSTVWCHVRMSVHRAPGVDRDEVVLVVVDISRRKVLEEQLIQGQRLEAVGRLAGGVAHEFNNALTVILGYARLMSGDLPAGDAAQEDLGEIIRAAERATRLTGQLLAFGRRQALQPRTVDLDGVLTDLVEMLDRLLGDDVELRRASEGRALPVAVDVAQLEQVLVSMAVNARDAMPGGGRLTIETRAGGEQGGDALLIVADTGVGMDDATREQIFDPFFTTKDQGEGSGLGLASVYGFVQQTGGSIEVESEPGQGTTFVIRLPLSRTSGPGAADAEPAERGGSETILVVEDEDSVRNLATRVLRSSGYRVLDASCGAEALRLCRSRPPGDAIDLVVTDVVMPGMNGRELIEQLSAAVPIGEVLFTSGHHEDEVLRRGLVDERFDFLPKPFDPDELLRTVRRLLDRQAT